MKRVITVIAIVSLVASTYVMSVAAMDFNKGTAEVICEEKADTNYSTLNEKTNKVDELLKQRAELKEQYDKTGDLEVADKLLDIDYSIEWYGVNTNARFYNKQVYEQNGLTGWKEGSVAYDAFTGEFISGSEPYTVATLDIFNK